MLEQCGCCNKIRVLTRLELEQDWSWNMVGLGARLVFWPKLVLEQG